MKTSVEISDDLYRRAKELAKRQGITLRSLIEQALEIALTREESPQRRWPDLSVDGQGLSPAVGEGTWEALSKRIYTRAGGE